MERLHKAAKLAGQLLTSDTTGEVASGLHPLTSMFYHFLARWEGGLQCLPLSAPLTLDL